MISQEELDLYDRLTDLFDDKMKHIIPGDFFYIKATQKVNVVLRYDSFWDTIEIETGTVHSGIGGYCYNKNVIRLPLPIDPRNPERGLWGMVDWEKWGRNINGEGIYLYDREIGEVHIDFTWNNPTLALLKALAAQEGVLR